MEAQNTRKNARVNLGRNDSVVFAQQQPDGGFASLRVTQEVADIVGEDDFGTRKNDRFLKAAFQRYAMAGFTGVLDFALVKETARMIAEEAQASDEARPGAGVRESELLSWVDEHCR